MTPKCGKNKEVTDEAIAECVTDQFLPHFDVFRDLLSIRGIIESFLLNNKEKGTTLSVSSSMRRLPIDQKNQSKYENNSAYYIKAGLLPQGSPQGTKRTK